MPTVGFLDDLKRQADAAKALQHTDTGALARNAQLADAACFGASTYFGSLAQQLDVLRPRSKGVFRLDKRHAFENLQLGDFRADSRRKQLRGADVFDHVVLRWKLTSGTRLALMKNFLPDIEQLESRLRRSGAQVNTQAIRHPDTAKLQEMRYELVADFFGSVTVTPEHDTGRVRFELVNLDGFEALTVEFPAFEVGSSRLDDLARWLMGEPHAFLKDGQALRRVEA